MGMLSAIGSIFSSKSKVVDDIFDKDKGHLTKIGSWIDEQQFTEQENRELKFKVGESVQKFAVDTMSENTERSIARRELAVLTIKFFFLLIFWSALVFPFNTPWSEYIFKLATQTHVGLLVLGVGGFFWGSHTLSKWQDKANKD